MQANCLVLFLILLVVNIDLSVGEPKRSFGFGRSRPKSNSNLSVRRRGHLAETPKAPAPAPKQTHTAHASHAASAPQGPPPAYSAGPSAGKTSLNAAPPAYSSHGAAPPSYSTAMGHGKYPQQPGYSGVNSGSNLNHQSAPSYGWNTNSHNSHYGNNGHYGGASHGGYAQPPPNYGGYHSGGYGGMPNYGGYGGMMGGGMMGGMGGMGGMGVQPIYMQQQKPSLLGGVAGYALTGLAGYQLARALGGGNGYNSHSQSTQHIYHHYDSPQQNGQMPSISENSQTPPQTPQQTLQTPSQNPQTNPQYSPSFPINPDVPSVPLAPFPSEVPTTVSPDCKENCTTEANFASVTPVPEAEFSFANIHPSLFLYAYPVPNKNLEYWAKSVDKKLNLTAPDANNPQTTTTP